MALVKFNRSDTKATATGSSMDKDTLYFPTDEQSIYLGGKRVGGDSVSHATNADYATNAGHANTADSATTAGSATSAETAGTAGKVGHALSLQLNGGSKQNFDGSAAVTFNVTPSGIGAAPSSHKHSLNQIDGAGTAAGKNFSTFIDTSANLPTSAAVKDYIDRQIKNYTSAFRYAGTLVKKSNGDWQINDIPSDISGNVGSIYMDFDTFVGSGEDDSLLKTGFTFYVMVGGTFDGETVEAGDMITCVGLYDGEGRWEPSYHIVNGNIIVTESVDASETSTKVPTSGAVRKAINALDSNVAADTNYVLTGVTETDGKLTAKKQVAVDQTYSPTSPSSNPASGKAIAAAIATLGSTKSASSGYAITGITQENGVIKSITQTAVNNYTHPSHNPTTGVPTANAAPGFGGTFKVGQVASDSQGHVTGQTERTITIPSTVATDSVTGLMSSADHTKLTTIGTDVSTLKSDVATLKSDVATLKSKVSTLESNVSTLTSALTWG